MTAISRTLQFLRDIQALKSLSPTSALAASSETQPLNTNRMTNKQRKRHFNSTIEAGRAEVAATAAEDDDVLTPLGYHLANMPLDPQCAKLLILGAVFGCLRPTVAVAACLTFKDPFEVPMGCQDAADRVRTELAEESQSDHWTYHAVLSVCADHSKLTALTMP